MGVGARAVVRAVGRSCVPRGRVFKYAAMAAICSGLYVYLKAGMRGVPFVMNSRMAASLPPALSFDSSGPNMPDTSVGRVWQTPHDCSNNRRPNFYCSLR